MSNQQEQNTNNNQVKIEEQKSTKDKIAKFPNWDVLPKSQFINPRVKKN
jgi:hypothetical protein